MYIYIKNLSVCFLLIWNLKRTMPSSTPVVPLKAIADSRPKWAKSIPVFRPERCKTIPFGWLIVWPVPFGHYRFHLATIIVESALSLSS